MEQTNVIPFAYLHLMKKEGVSVSDLDSETQSYIKDLKQTTQVLINRAKGGEIKVSAQTERKIKNYDRAICEGIYDYLESKDSQGSQQSKEDAQLKAIHEKQQAEKGGEVKKESTSSLQDIDLTPNEPEVEESKEEEQKSEGYTYKGFWDWD
tara:strand:- start:285 stop:740 length:456 start_codon:yes stop_codon:yes gene_type:complete